MGRRNNGLSEQWAVGIMGCRNNGSSELWAVGIMTRNQRAHAEQHPTIQCVQIYNFLIVTYGVHFYITSNALQP